MRYIITPVLSTELPWSIGEPYYEEDIYTEKLSAREWVEQLQSDGCTHVYLHMIDDSFRENYKEAFVEGSVIDEEKMYILKRHGKKMLLEELS